MGEAGGQSARNVIWTSTIFLWVRISGLGEAAAPREHRRAALPPRPARPHPYPGEWGSGGPGGRRETNGTRRELPDIGHRRRPQASCSLEIDVTRPWRGADALPGGLRRRAQRQALGAEGPRCPRRTSKAAQQSARISPIKAISCPPRPPRRPGPPGSGKEPPPRSAPGVVPARGRPRSCPGRVLGVAFWEERGLGVRGGS